MQNAICKGRVLPDGLGLNQCLIDWKKPLPRSRIGYPMCFHHQLKFHALGKIGELSTEL